MAWIGLVVGIVVGGLAGGFGGALVFGIIGAIAGAVMKSDRPAAEDEPKVAPIMNDTPQDQIDRLHTTLAHLQQRVVRLEAALERQAQAQVGPEAAAYAPGGVVDVNVAMKAPQPARKEVRPPAEAAPAPQPVLEPVVEPIIEPVIEPVIAKVEV